MFVFIRIRLQQLQILLTNYTEDKNTGILTMNFKALPFHQQSKKSVFDSKPNGKIKVRIGTRKNVRPVILPQSVF